MVSEQHTSKADLRPPDRKEADPVEQRVEGVVYGMEFVDIKYEPLGEDANVTIKEEEEEEEAEEHEREPLPDSDDCDKLLPSQSMELEDEEPLADDDTNSLSSDDSDDSSVPDRVKRGGKASAIGKKEPKVDKEILEFYPLSRVSCQTHKQSQSCLLVVHILLHPYRKFCRRRRCRLRPGPGGGGGGRTKSARA